MCGQQNEAFHFRFGSKADIPTCQGSCPLYPRKRTLVGESWMSVKCQFRKSGEGHFDERLELPEGRSSAQYSHRFAMSDANALRTSDCEIPNCRAILDGVTPALKAARTAFNFPCVKGTAVGTSTRRVREISAGGSLPRRLCSATTADSNWPSSWSLRCLTAFDKFVGRTWREGIAFGEPTDSEDCE